MVAAVSDRGKVRLWSGSTPDARERPVGCSSGIKNAVFVTGSASDSR